MKKIKTMFVKDLATQKVTEEIRPECTWVLGENVKATIKFDGTAAKFMNGQLFKRWDRKLKAKFAKKRNRLGDKFVFESHMMKDVPDGAIPCEENPDLHTFHHPHWIAVDENKPEDQWFIEALKKASELKEGQTYELIGEKLQGNPYNIVGHELVAHGSIEVDVDFTFESLKNWILSHKEEGLVFHHPDGRMCKLRRKDFISGVWFK